MSFVGSGAATAVAHASLMSFLKFCCVFWSECQNCERMIFPFLFAVFIFVGAATGRRSGPGDLGEDGWRNVNLIFVFRSLNSSSARPSVFLADEQYGLAAVVSVGRFYPPPPCRLLFTLQPPPSPSSLPPSGNIPGPLSPSDCICLAPSKTLGLMRANRSLRLPARCCSSSELSWYEPFLRTSRQTGQTHKNWCGWCSAAILSTPVSGETKDSVEEGLLATPPFSLARRSAKSATFGRGYKML